MCEFVKVIYQNRKSQQMMTEIWLELLNLWICEFAEVMGEFVSHM